jgi:molecular chaperone GrpE
MSPDTPRDPQDESALPAEESDELVDLNLDDSPDEDLQSIADEVASGYSTQMLPEEEPTGSIGNHVDLESAMIEAEHQMEEMLRRESELMDQHRRLAADFNNFRNRAQRDVAMAVEQAERKILLEILPVLDNFDRGLGATYQTVDSFQAGMDLVRKQFLEALRRMNVEPLPLQVGDPFDALHAEALTTLSNPELPDGAVAAVYERGFNLKGQLLRAARVVVNRAHSADNS